MGFRHVRTLGADVHRAAGGVLAEQRALGAAQHFHMFHVEGVEELRLHGGHDEVVYLHGHGRVLIHDDVGDTNTTHGKRGGIECRDLRGREARDRRSELRQVFGDPTLNVTGGDSGHRDRRGLQVGVRTACGGNGHFFQRFLRVDDGRQSGGGERKSNSLPDVEFRRCARSHRFPSRSGDRAAKRIANAGMQRSTTELGPLRRQRYAVFIKKTSLTVFIAAQSVAFWQQNAFNR